MSAWTSAAANITRSWVVAYTLGLAAGVRESRRCEIASDLWEHQQDAAGSSSNPLGIGLQIISRTLRGLPADLLWRINVEGPQMDIRIPVERVMGGMLVAMVALVMITGAISGIDTTREGFANELVKFADKSALENNGDAAFRILTGLSWIVVAAGFFVTLRERTPALAAIAGFGLLAAAVLELTATGLQIVLVDLADDYVIAAPTEQATLLTTAHAVALTVQMTTTLALVGLLGSIYVLALATAHQNLVPRWLLGIPALSAVGLGTGMTIAAAGGGDDWVWVVTMSGLMLGLVWLLIAGMWLIFTPRGDSPKATPAPAGVS
jgi:hypothetical protein